MICVQIKVAFKGFIFVNTMRVNTTMQVNKTEVIIMLIGSISRVTNIIHKIFDQIPKQVCDQIMSKSFNTMIVSNIIGGELTIIFSICCHIVFSLIPKQRLINSTHFILHRASATFMNESYLTITNIK